MKNVCFILNLPTTNFKIKMTTKVNMAKYNYILDIAGQQYIAEFTQDEKGNISLLSRLDNETKAQKNIATIVLTEIANCWKPNTNYTLNLVKACYSQTKRIDGNNFLLINKNIVSIKSEEGIKVYWATSVFDTPHVIIMCEDLNNYNKTQVLWQKKTILEQLYKNIITHNCPESILAQKKISQTKNQMNHINENEKSIIYDVYEGQILRYELLLNEKKECEVLHSLLAVLLTQDKW